MKLQHRTRCGLAALAATTLMGCELLSGGSGSALDPVPPTASLRTVELSARPTNSNLAAYFCNDYGEGIPFAQDACAGFFGAVPAKADIKFSFETVFDLGNANEFPIPTVEMLLGLDVFPGTNVAELGAVCVSFCDPEREACEEMPPGSGCQPPDKNVNDIEDFVPTVEDFIRIGASIAAGNDLIDDNILFRVIPSVQKTGCSARSEAREVDGQNFLCDGDDCQAVEPGCRVTTSGGQTCSVCPGQLEARIRFDLGLDPMLKVLDGVLGDSTDQLLGGNSPSFDIPYDARGSLFFDIPILGRHALGYGPLGGVWSLDD